MTTTSVETAANATETAANLLKEARVAHALSAPLTLLPVSLAIEALERVLDVLTVEDGKMLDEIGEILNELAVSYTASVWHKWRLLNGLPSQMLVNLTPHPIRITGDSFSLVSEGVAHVNVTSSQCGEICGVPIYEDVWELEGLPPPSPGVVYVVSMVAKIAAKAAGRTDVVSQDSGPTAVRENGQIVSVRGFVR